MSIQTFLINCLFIISGMAVSLLCSHGSILIIAVNMACSFALLVVMAFKYHVPERFVKRPFNKKYLAAAAVFALAAIYSNSFRFWGKGAKLLEKLGKYIEIPQVFNTLVIYAYNFYVCALFVFGLVFTISVFYYFLLKAATFVKRMIASLTKTEKIYLTVVAIISVGTVSVVFNMTNIFYAPVFNEKTIACDLIYSSDSPMLLSTNVYMNIAAPENDIRQPLFGLFAMPFGIVAFIASKVLFLIPNAYPILINIIQIIILQISILLLARMLELNRMETILVLLAVSFSYPTLLFSFMMEQYIFAVFWLLFYIYVCIYNKHGKDGLYIAATGSLLPSGILFPLFLLNIDKTEALKKLARVFAQFILVITLTGQLPLVLNNLIPVSGGWTIISLIKSFGGVHIPFTNRILQYFNFVSSCFVAPRNAGVIDTHEFPSYQLGDVSTPNMLGIVIIILTLAGFILNYKKLFARVCAFWAVFSFIILCVVGWGTRENGLILYSLYFYWAFFALIIMLIEKVLGATHVLKYALYIAVIVSCAFFNIPGIWEIIRFGIERYPV